MSDPETRNEIVDVVKEGCALRSVLTQKPCPYFGASKSCLDCTYDWVTIAANVRKVVEKRRASYEQEQGKVKALTADLEESQSAVNKLEAIVLPLGASMRAAQRHVEDVENMKAEEAAKAEEEDAGQGES